MADAVTRDLVAVAVHVLDVAVVSPLVTHVESRGDGTPVRIPPDRRLKYTIIFPATKIAIYIVYIVRFSEYKLFTTWKMDSYSFLLRSLRLSSKVSITS